jgi:hypothetical protein
MTGIAHIFIALCKTSSNKYILVQQTLDYSIAVNKQTCLVRHHGVLEVAFLLHEPMRIVGISARRPWLPASMIRIFHYWMIKKSLKMNAAAFVSSKPASLSHFKSSI